MSNMELWNKYAKPPAEAQKPFSNGSFSGTDISPMWRIRCLTEEFGACGIGWYSEIVEHWTDEVEGIMTAHVRIRLYFIDKVSGEWSKPVEAVGGNSFVRKVGGKPSDEAYKMAYTDALGGACKMLGIGGAVYWERGYSKYENDYTNDTNKQTATTPKQIPTEIFGTPNEVEDEPPIPKDSPEDAAYRILALRAYKVERLNASCRSKFKTDFRHTPVAKLRTVLTEEMLNAKIEKEANK